MSRLATAKESAEIRREFADIMRKSLAHSIRHGSKFTAELARQAVEEFESEAALFDELASIQAWSHV